MSAILDLITREQNKLERRKAAVAATEEEIKILGDSAKLQNKLARQKAFVKESQDNISKLNKAAK
jgi:hypothetical protein